MNTNEPSQFQSSLDLKTYEKQQHKGTLSTILIITMVAAAIFGALNLFFYESQEPARVFFAVSILCVPAIWLNRRDYYRAAGLITSLLVFCMAHYNLVDGAGLRDPGVVAYPIIILVGGLLFGKSAVPVFTITGIVSLVSVVWLAGSFDADTDRLIIISILLLAGAGATRAVIKNTESNIGRIRASEENLRVALEHARKHAQRINDIIETVPEGVLLLNGLHQVILVNRTAREFLALLAPGHLGDFPLEVLGPLEQIGQYSVEELFRHREDGWLEIVLDEPERIFEVTVRQVRNVPPPYENWVLVLKDATLERKQQDFLREQDRLATVGQLASGIAHDFRNILSIISTYSQIVQRRPQIAKRNEYLNVIQEQIKDAVNLIEQILDFGRRAIMQRQAIDVAALIEDVIVILKRTLPSSILIEFIHESGNDVVNADKSRLHQVLLNLALNARDAMPDGGKLTFLIMNSDPPNGLVIDSDLSERDWLKIQVSDTGKGIHPGDLPYIFEPFYTTKETGKGTGLGLAQVYGIIKQHKGEIMVESEVNQGTTFTLFLPTIIENPESSAVRINKEPIIGRTIQVLLVEDNQLTRESTEEMLKMLDCEVITADNGRKALELFTNHQNSIDLVLSDIVMPGMGGVELYQELQKIAPDIKFLVVTGYPLNTRARQLMEQGRIDWIQKPFLAEDLSEKMAKLLLQNPEITA